MTLSTYDLFTPKEAEIHARIIEIMNAIDKLESAAKKEKRALPREIKEPYIREKKKTLQLLIDEIKKHEGTPRTVRLRSILNLKKFPEGVMPTGVTWKTLKVSRRIAEFASEESRALGLNHLDVTFDKIVVKWKSPDVLRQLVLNGFIVPILKPDGTIEQRHYRFHTASAGQLRTDKCQFLSDDAWDRIKDRLQCGLTWDSINAKGGVNVGKFLAYTSLPSSATVEWDIDLDRAIVIKDFEANVTGMMDYITQEYKIERGIRTVPIKHTDGIGMALPGVLRKLCDSDNVMVRGNYIKGLQTTFDFVRFIREHKCSPAIKDVWGQPHNVIEENIQIIFTASQFKMWNFYDSWNQFKGFYYCCGAKFGLTNFEEPWIKDTEINYQMLQTLADFTDEELNAFIAPTHDRIQNLATNQEAMLKTLRADVDSDNPYQRALAIYPEILRDGYSKESLKAIKKRMTLDAMSGAIRCKNKRLFAIPDMYAACEFWFENIEQPKGLLEDGEVFSSLYWNEEEADILRSPHLSFEHAIRRFNHSPEVASWFTTKGIYTSCHDLISRILQFDVDGDQLNVVTEEPIISAAKRNRDTMDIVPLFYDANKAKPQYITIENLYLGLKQAHDFSNIGQISNMLTRLWNKDCPNYDAAKLLTMYNNYVIDAAKTGFVNSYADHKESKEIVSKAIGGKIGRMPHFFQFSKNGRHQSKENMSKKRCFLKPNNSTMNRIWKSFTDIGNINMNYAEVKPFNWMMLMPSCVNDINMDAINVFCSLDDSNIANMIKASSETSLGEREEIQNFELLSDMIAEELRDKFGSLEECYPSIVKYLFTGDNAQKQAHKQMFWRVFGDLACGYIGRNIVDCHICNKCGMKIPNWYPVHTCSKDITGFVTCVDCGKIVVRRNSRQIRCPECQEKQKALQSKLRMQRYRERKRYG